jgi:hypothetical protein
MSRPTLCMQLSCQFIECFAQIANAAEKRSHACRASIGEIDNDLDSNVDLERIRAEPLKPF